MSATATGAENPNAYTMDGAYLVSYRFPSRAATNFIRFLQDTLDEDAFDEVYYADEHLNVTGVDEPDIDYVDETIKTCLDKVEYASTVLMLKDRRMYSDDPFLTEGYALGSGKLRLRQLLREAEERGGFWSIYLDEHSQ